MDEKGFKIRCWEEPAFQNLNLSLKLEGSDELWLEVWSEGGLSDLFPWE